MSIRRTIESDRTPRFADLRSPQGRVLPIVWVGTVLSMLQQLVGINSIFYYGDVLWQSVGFSSTDSLRNNVITGLINIVATLVASFQRSSTWVRPRVASSRRSSSRVII